MAIVLLSVVPRHERRFRLTFSNSLAAGAFGAPAPSYYTLTNEDGKAAAPSIAAAMMVPGTPAVVELSLNGDLVQGALYKIAAVGVPAVDASVTPAGSEQPFRYATKSDSSSVEPVVRDRERLLYGVDLVWTGMDYQEAANGDLERIGGRPNVTKALWRSVQTSGLPWDESWGLDVREWVDSPSSASTPLRGRAVTQIMRDPRVQTVKVELEIDGAKTYLHLTPTLASGEATEPVTVTIPNDT